MIPLLRTLQRVGTCLLMFSLILGGVTEADAQVGTQPVSVAISRISEELLLTESAPYKSMRPSFELAAWSGVMASTAPAYGDPRLGLTFRTTAATDATPDPSEGGGGSSPYSSQTLNSSLPTPSFGNMFFKGWVIITGVEFALIGVCAAMPRSFTGWSEHMVDDALRNLNIAFTKPPVWDDDAWAINYVGHPYGGAVYYNTVRCQGASFFQSFLFSTALSLQWEYIIEAVAEPPSTQDLLFTSTSGAILGEAIHITTNYMKKNGTNLFEKVFILIMNPTSVLFNGLN